VQATRSTMDATDNEADAPIVRGQASHAISHALAEALMARLGPDLEAVDAVIHDRMASTVALIPNLAGYLIEAGGKRLRPAITLASAHMFGRAGPPAQSLAAAVEFIHTATLLHDDVVDGSAMRRGKSAANLVWGNAASVLVGDFLFARAFNLMVETGDMRILDILARASSVIAEGEVMQLAAAANADATIPRYMEIIAAKTAALFAAAAEAGALAGGASVMQGEAMRAYGHNLGLAFQLADDALDYGGSSEALGKDTGDDFREGKVTLPVAIARSRAQTDEEHAFWTRVLGAGGANQMEGDFERALGLVHSSGALGDTLTEAHDFADAAIAALAEMPAGPWRDGLAGLAALAVDRIS
jgi:octaprenyl-diphosphate synthase